MRTTSLLIAGFGVVACAHRKADTTPATSTDSPASVPDAAETLHTPVAAEPGPKQAIEVEPSELALGETVTIRYLRPGLNGCYHQSEAERTVDGRSLSFSYTTWYDQAEPGQPLACVAMIPLGGFQAQFTPDQPGEWAGHVIVDGAEALSFHFTVHEPSGQE